MCFLPESLCFVIQAEGEVNAVMQVRHNVLTVEVIGFPWMDVHELLFDLQRNAFGRFATISRNAADSCSLSTIPIRC